MAILGYSVLISLVVYGLYFGIRTLYRYKKKQILLPSKWWFEDGINFGVNVLLSFLFSLVLALAFGGYTFWNAILYQVVVSLVILFVKPFSFYQQIREKETFAEDNRRKSAFKIVLLALLVLETFAFNGRSYKDNLSMTYLASDSTSLTYSSDVTYSKDGKPIFIDKSYVYVETTNKASRFSFDFDNPNSYEITFKIEGYASGKSLGNVSYVANPVVKDSINFGLTGFDSSLDSFRVTFDFSWGREGYGDNATTVDSLTLKGVELDSPILFDFSFLRFSLLTLLGFFICNLSHVVKTFEKKVKDVSRKIELGILITGGVSLIIFFIVSLCDKAKFFTTYPFSNPVEQYDIYTQMFDAFKKGQLNIDTTSTNLWDHAYYNGKCYSYYGILPVLLVSFPMYWLTGLVPNVLFIQFVGAIVEITVLLILVTELCRLFFKKMNIPTLFFFLVLVFICSLSLSLVTFKSYHLSGSINNPVVEGIYHIPTIYGLLNLDLFILFALYAYSNPRYRMMNLSFMGLSFVFIMASRPNLFLSLIFVSPLLIKMLIDKEKKIGKRLLDFVPMALILIAGATFVMLYNQKRFDSVFEFGQRYQNTISNQDDLSIKANQILPGLFHFFLNPWGFESHSYFPFICTTNPQITASKTDYSFYLNYFSGVFSIPFFLSILLLPFSMQKDDDKFLNVFLWLFLLTMGVLAVVTYSFAGLCPRYMLEIYHLASILSVIVCYKFLLKKASSRNVLLPLFAVVAIASMFLCWNLSRNSFDGLNEADLGGWLLRIREVFGYYNV
jgi:hypothetical protein